MGVEMKHNTLPPTDPKDFVFLGPIGTGFLVGFLPFIVVSLYALCPGETCMNVQELLFKDIPTLQWSDVYSPRAVQIFSSWMAFQTVLYIVLPGDLVKGVELRDGSRLEYRMNGFLAFCISLIGSMVAHQMGIINLAEAYDEYLPLACTAIAFSYLLSTYLYLTSFIGNRMLAEGGVSGNPFYDFFMGRELNPRIGDFDLKVFCELRPGLIGWCVLDLAMAAKQVQLHGELSNSMALVNVFQIFYVLDSFWSEAALLTTMDVTEEGFGFMLAFGDLAWVPFTYTLQARYLVSHPQYLSVAAVVAIVALNAAGYAIFRLSNRQKNLFRNNPDDPAVAHIEYMKTDRGTRLMTSGWWGIARHINYFGDMLQGLAWCLPCGFGHQIPYFYAIYFTTLLIHRDLRDGDNCQKKYGKDWDKYCSLVKSRIIPYVY
ncbi:hypothetical protein SARC_06234 [Sphaeroforma arctica JP610]|uniref:Delta(14)-sterol reductase ERG24 n=1 Tax=Sphaeroforma arctica JP610 TaxID=667725 RepID=A0A0L0FX77_9EUKA|nr:hypothetical protein SARC_06234 [Sphaeroforma arctica JP610]KNC81445.1 hypothetical protein SARC_06234 [Sphaeroforma arctica JP610]|eukprot:XP_014155347.1 hypothetical protein SARC_06234 [Sphaeroforma arctica JP610]